MLVLNQSCVNLRSPSPSSPYLMCVFLEAVYLAYWPKCLHVPDGAASRSSPIVLPCPGPPKWRPDPREGVYQLSARLGLIIRVCVCGKVERFVSIVALQPGRISSINAGLWSLWKTNTHTLGFSASNTLLHMWKTTTTVWVIQHVAISSSRNHLLLGKIWYVCVSLSVCLCVCVCLSVCLCECV